jgi:hypothetical protein
MLVNVNSSVTTMPSGEGAFGDRGFIPFPTLRWVSSDLVSLMSFPKIVIHALVNAVLRACG